MLSDLPIKSTLLFEGKADFFIFHCPIKYLTGIDCPGCGFQRSVMALLHGEFYQSFILYPPTIPFLVSFCCGISSLFLKGIISEPKLKVMYLSTGSIMAINYAYKILTHQIF